MPYLFIFSYNPPFCVFISLFSSFLSSLTVAWLPGLIASPPRLSLIIRRTRRSLVHCQW